MSNRLVYELGNDEMFTVLSMTTLVDLSYDAINSKTLIKKNVYMVFLFLGPFQYHSHEKERDGGGGSVTLFTK